MPDHHTGSLTCCSRCMCSKSAMYMLGFVARGVESTATLHALLVVGGDSRGDLVMKTFRAKTSWYDPQRRRTRLLLPGRSRAEPAHQLCGGLPAVAAGAARGWRRRRAAPGGSSWSATPWAALWHAPHWRPWHRSPSMVGCCSTLFHHIAHMSSGSFQQAGRTACCAAHNLACAIWHWQTTSMKRIETRTSLC